MSSLHQGFTEAGSAADAQASFRWLDQADGHPLVQRLKQRLIEICPVSAGDRVLDVGCGLGHEARRLADMTGPDGQVAGIDANPVMIAEARSRVDGLGLPVTFDVADAHQLAFADGTFDVCRTERVLRYVDRPAAVLAEMVRVARPGGAVLAFDFDSDMTIVDAPDAGLARRLAEVLDAAVPHPWIGRQMFGLFLQAGLADVQVEPHGLCLAGPPGLAIYRQLNAATIDRARQAGQIGEAEVAAWWAALEQAAEAGTFFAASLGVIATGRKQ